MTDLRPGIIRYIRRLRRMRDIGVINQRIANKWIREWKWKLYVLEEEMR